MNKKIQKTVLEYIKEVKEATGIDITDKVNKLHAYGLYNIREAINILENDKKIRKVHTHKMSNYNIYCLTRKGYEVMAPWYKRIFYFFKNLILSLIKIKINIDT